MVTISDYHSQSQETLSIPLDRIGLSWEQECSLYFCAESLLSIYPFIQCRDYSIFLVICQVLFWLF